MRIRTSAGFSLVEIVVVVGIVGAIVGISIPALMSFVADSKADGAAAAVVNTMRTARDRAIGERRNFQLRFIMPNQIQIARVDLLGATEIISNTFLEGNLEFRYNLATGDTGDGFGAGTPIAFGASATRMFTSEGTFVDTTGDPLNGTIFLAAENVANSERAITILGATALIHSWRWNGRAWVD
jgi:type II secretory pathway pseudopilin PulG